MPGTLVLVIGPSGSGKGALMAHLREVAPELVYPVSCTTRAPRPGEEHGHMYYFLTNEEFDAKIAAGEFLEWAEYGGNRYGTLRSEIVPALEAGKGVVREIEVQGARLMEAAIPKECIRIVFIDAGPWEDLERRIRERAAISPEELRLRKERFEDELTFKERAFRVVSNRDGELGVAREAFVAAVREAVAR